MEENQDENDLDQLNPMIDIDLVLSKPNIYIPMHEFDVDGVVNWFYFKDEQLFICRVHRMVFVPKVAQFHFCRCWPKNFPTVKKPSSIKKIFYSYVSPGGKAMETKSDKFWSQDSIELDRPLEPFVLYQGGYMCPIDSCVSVSSTNQGIISHIYNVHKLGITEYKDQIVKGVYFHRKPGKGNRLFHVKSNRHVEPRIWAQPFRSKSEGESSSQQNQVEIKNENEDQSNISRQETKPIYAVCAVEEVNPMFDIKIIKNNPDIFVPIKEVLEDGKLNWFYWKNESLFVCAKHGLFLSHQGVRKHFRTLHSEQGNTTTVENSKMENTDPIVLFSQYARSSSAIPTYDWSGSMIKFEEPMLPFILYENGYLCNIRGCSAVYGSMAGIWKHDKKVHSKIERGKYPPVLVCYHRCPGKAANLVAVESHDHVTPAKWISMAARPRPPEDQRDEEPHQDPLVNPMFDPVMVKDHPDIYVPIKDDDGEDTCWFYWKSEGLFGCLKHLKLMTFAGAKTHQVTYHPQTKEINPRKIYGQFENDNKEIPSLDWENDSFELEEPVKPFVLYKGGLLCPIEDCRRVFTTLKSLQAHVLTHKITLKEFTKQYVEPGILQTDVLFHKLPANRHVYVKSAGKLEPRDHQNIIGLLNKKRLRVLQLQQTTQSQTNESQEHGIKSENGQDAQDEDEQQYLPPRKKRKTRSNQDDESIHQVSDEAQVILKPKLENPDETEEEIEEEEEGEEGEDDDNDYDDDDDDEDPEQQEIEGYEQQEGEELEDAEQEYEHSEASEIGENQEVEFKQEEELEQHSEEEGFQEQEEVEQEESLDADQDMQQEEEAEYDQEEVEQQEYEQVELEQEGSQAEQQESDQEEVEQEYEQGTEYEQSEQQVIEDESGQSEDQQYQHSDAEEQRSYQDETEQPEYEQVEQLDSDDGELEHEESEQVEQYESDREVAEQEYEQVEQVYSEDEVSEQEKIELESDAVATEYQESDQEEIELESDGVATEYQESDQEEIDAVVAEYQESDQEEIDAVVKEYQESDQEAIDAVVKEYQESDQEGIDAVVAEYQESDQEEIDLDQEVEGESEQGDIEKEDEELEEANESHEEVDDQEEQEERSNDSSDYNPVEDEMDTD